MKYLLDADVLIEAKNRHYGFDFCPAFWDWVEHKNKEKIVYSIEKVKDEITRGNDTLAKWVKDRDADFFLPIDDSLTTQAMKDIVNWVQNENLSPASKTQFFSGADQFLVACAKAHGYTVVTHEAFIKEAAKIPTVCRALGVHCVDPFQMLRDAKASFTFLKPELASV